MQRVNYFYKYIVITLWINIFVLFFKCESFNRTILIGLLRNACLSVKRVKSVFCFVESLR